MLVPVAGACLLITFGYKKVEDLCIGRATNFRQMMHCSGCTSVGDTAAQANGSLVGGFVSARGRIEGGTNEFSMQNRSRHVVLRCSRCAIPTISSTCTPDPEQSFPDPSRAERVGTVECSGSASNLLGSYPQGRTGRPRSQQEGPVRAAE